MSAWPENVVFMPGVVRPLTESEANADLAGFLKDLASQAEKGVLQSFYGCAFDENGDMVVLMSGDHCSPLEVVGGLDIVKDAYKSIIHS